MKRILLFFLVIILIQQLTVLCGCANMIPPTGGDKDTLPPRLLKVTPPDSSTLFNNKTITFTFDEFIEDVMQQNPQQNMLVSPSPTFFPVLKSKLNTLSLTLKDTLEPNTTYRIEFGDVIKDVNERNVLKDFSFIFSTGAVLDSLELTGKVLLAETGKPDTTLIVMLHRNGDDSAVIKEKPRYVTKLDGKGNFRFQYLPAGTFHIYALKDENGTRRYFNSSNLFAFTNTPVEVKPGADAITLYASAEKKDQPATPLIGLPAGRGPGTRTDDRRLRFGTNLNNNIQDLLQSFFLSFDVPLRNLDTSKLYFRTDSAYNSLSGYSWETDSLRKKITLKTTWKENTLYHLILDRDFAEDSTGKKLLKTDTISFTTRKKENYGSVKISFAKLDLSKNPVLQFNMGSQVVKTVPLTSAEFQQSLFPPGEYELTLLMDENKNGKWDPGQFFGKRKQPELVKPLDKKINIRANWDNEFEINL
jgi:uncharacterized protein (DUF2141 family)